MRHPSSSISSFSRPFAGAMLVILTLAQFLCVWHCHSNGITKFAGLNLPSERPISRSHSCCARANSTPTSDAAGSNLPADPTGSCLMLAVAQSSSIGLDQTGAILPSQLSLPQWWMSPIQPLKAIGPLHSTASGLSARFDFVFLPERCLGALMRTNAPPSVA
jgi:hypothetical protein